MRFRTRSILRWLDLSRQSGDNPPCHEGPKVLGNVMKFHPPSPCNSICKLDPESGFCLGCKRTLDEIVDWPMLRASEKTAVLAKLNER